MSQGQGPAKGVKHPELRAQEYKREDRYIALALTWGMGTTDHADHVRTSVEPTTFNSKVSRLCPVKGSGSWKGGLLRALKHLSSCGLQCEHSK